MTRRTLLAGAGGVAAVAALPRLLHAQPQAASLGVETLRSGVAVVSGAGANITVASTGDALLLVDGGASEHAAALRALLAERWPGLPVRTLFNTNWREEHTDGNAALRAAGAKIVAHENTKLWLGADFVVEWEQRAHRPAAADALPTDTFYTSGRLDFGGDEAAYAVLPRAHTDGDLYVHLPKANVLVVSDVLAVDRYPIVDYSTGGWIGGLEKATKTLLEVADDDTLIVPALGPAQKRAALQDQLAMCTAVRERVAQAFRTGMSLAAFAASAPTREFDARRGDPSQFLKLVYKGALGHSRELGGVI
jgi:glyoxylase-like metal-dependent hydrolase (beta-lactamase superfamily II)